MTSIDRRRLLRGAAATVVTTAVAKEALSSSTVSALNRAIAPVANSPALGNLVAAAGTPLGTPGSLDDRPPPQLDPSRANKLPSEMTGYWEKSFDIGGIVRTAKVYISPETPIRSYYTVIAVPDGIDTAEFLQRSWWNEIADEREEGLFILEPGPDGWASAADEAAYVNAAIGFHQSNDYYSIYGVHYFVGYGAGGPGLEAWAVANPLRVISQTYLESPGLPQEYFDAYAAREFDGDSPGFYTDVVFPDGFQLIRYDEVVLPTWFIHSERNSIDASLTYWKRANDTDEVIRWNRRHGNTFEQRRDSERWMTSYGGPTSVVIDRWRRMNFLNRTTTRAIVDFLTHYTRYENSFAYGNQLYPRADYAKLGVERRTMTVEGALREFLVYVPKTSRRYPKKQAPVVFVWPGNTQTAKVFFDAAPWWQVAEREGCILVVIGEDYSSPISVTHRDSNAFFLQLRELMINEYPVDPTRFYSTGQSLGSLATQEFAVAFPEYFAAVASTSFTAAPDDGTVNIDGVDYPASGRTIPNYHIYGYGDLPFLAGGLWDDTQNRLDSWAEYFLAVNGLDLSDVDDIGGELSGFKGRFQTWTWYDGDVAVLKLTKNNYRSHNTIASECPLMWEFLHHYSSEVQPDGSVARYYSPSGFRRRNDSIQI